MTNKSSTLKTFRILTLLGLVFAAYLSKATFPFDYHKKQMMITINGEVDSYCGMSNDKLTCFSDSLQEEDGPITIVEQMAQYPGGEKELMRFIQANIRYPEEAKTASAQGTVYVALFIDKEGKPKNAKVIRSVHPALDAEALRVISLLSDWIPAKQQGKPVVMRFTLPVRFNLLAFEEKSKMPRFPGGEVAFLEYIMKNITYPAEAVKDSAKGTVNVTFSVNNQGKVEDVKVSLSVHPALDEEAIRVVNSSPEWTPGKEVSYEVPVNFDIKMMAPSNEVMNTDSIFTFDMVEEKPQFPGGERKMMEFIKNNLKYPVLAQEMGYQGTVIVNFVVREDGKIFLTKVLKGISWDLDAEALRIIKIMPDWKPGKVEGKPVKVSFIIPLKFVLN
jgi:TonB family protein